MVRKIVACLTGAAVMLALAQPALAQFKPWPSPFPGKPPGAITINVTPGIRLIGGGNISRPGRELTIPSGGVPSTTITFGIRRLVVGESACLGPTTSS